MPTHGNDVCLTGWSGSRRYVAKPTRMTQLRNWRGVLRLGPRRLFGRPGRLVVDRDTRRTQPGQQYSSYRGRIESNVLGVWWMCFTALQSERQVQLLAKVLNDEIDLTVTGATV
jgi:hypothetical protein